MIEICHITTVHSRYDVRIFHKECISLSPIYSVNLIVADGLGNETKNGIKIHDIGLRQNNRLKRAKTDSKKALKKALELNCQLYHFHDPERIKVGLRLKKAKKKVIYDVHEDLPRQIYGKPYLNNLIKPLISNFVEYIENYISKKLDYIITATPFITERFQKKINNTVDIRNYPLLNEIKSDFDFNKKENEICYVGGISEYRGICELIESLNHSKIKLNLAGDFDSEYLEHKCKNSKGWKFVDYHGFVSRKEIAGILNKSKIGIVTLHPLVNYLDSLPVKMFEYMFAGIPVIASDFPLWIKIVNDNHCGINVNPLDSNEIASAVQELLSNPDKAEEMGKNGQKAVKEKYNWSIEEKKLLKVYKDILGE